MVRYYFVCDQQHIFDAWFKSIEFFEEQIKTKGNIVCPICESSSISRKLVAPSIIKKGNKKTKTVNKEEISTDVEKINKYITELNRYVEKNFSYVGNSFKEVALKMHKGELEKNNIYGEANTEEIKELHEEGISILPLSIKPNSKKIN